MLVRRLSSIMGFGNETIERREMHSFRLMTKYEKYYPLIFTIIQISYSIH